MKDVVGTLFMAAVFGFVGFTIGVSADFELKFKEGDRVKVVYGFKEGQEGTVTSHTWFGFNNYKVMLADESTRGFEFLADKCSAWFPAEQLQLKPSGSDGTCVAVSKDTIQRIKDEICREVENKCPPSCPDRNKDHCSHGHCTPWWKISETVQHVDMSQRIQGSYITEAARRIKALEDRQPCNCGDCKCSPSDKPSSCKCPQPCKAAGVIFVPVVEPAKVE